MELEEIINRLRAHPNIRTKSKIAEICGGSRQALRFWTRVPAEHCRKLEKACGGELTRYDMRPDVFGPAPDDDSDLDVA